MTETSLTVADASGFAPGDTADIWPGDGRRRRKVATVCRVTGDTVWLEDVRRESLWRYLRRRKTEGIYDFRTWLAEKIAA